MNAEAEYFCYSYSQMNTDTLDYSIHETTYVLYSVSSHTDFAWKSQNKPGKFLPNYQVKMHK